MGRRTRFVALIAIALLVLPLLAIPLYVLGGRIADGLDQDDSNGVLALNLLLGVGGPGLLAVVIAWRKVNVSLAVVLGFASSIVSVAVLFVAFLIYCNAVNCIV
jgi:hypothetical protein